MSLRAPQNPHFYTARREDCERWIRDIGHVDHDIDPKARLVAGIAPHAGWSFSGSLASEVVRALGEHARPETLIIFGAVHYLGVHENAAYPAGAWRTPVGDLEIDGELASRLDVELGDLLVLDESAHEREHSIEVLLPFVKTFCKNAKILPIAVPPGERSAELGSRIGKATPGTSVAALGSTDLTHYGSHFGLTPAGRGERAREWMRENDARMLEILTRLQADEAVEEASTHLNACGSGAIAATLAFAREHGAIRGELLEYTTSFDVRPDAVFESAVGYAGVVM